jgi:hypothetical protein
VRPVGTTALIWYTPGLTIPQKQQLRGLAANSHLRQGLRDVRPEVRQRIRHAGRD